MLVADSMIVRNDFDRFFDMVLNGETLIISSSNGESVVMLPESEYNELTKAKRNAELYSMLDKSMEEAEAGGFVAKSIEELSVYE